MSFNLKKVKSFIHKNKRFLSPAFDFAKESIGDISHILDKEKTNVLDYVSLGFELKSNFDRSFQLSDPANYFRNKSWTQITTHDEDLDQLVVNLVSEACPPQAVVTHEEGAAYISLVQNINFGWLVFENSLEHVYVDAESSKEFRQVLENLFWEKFNKNVIIGVKGDNVYIEKDEQTKDFILSDKAVHFSELIQQYFDAGLGRSLLFYGPPGSGKSNIVRTISGLLKLRTIRINNISQLNNHFISCLLTLANPDCLILDDIDSVSIEEISDILEKFENFNKRNKLILATANRVSSLKDALLRPGRFDQPIEIKRLDDRVVMSLVNDDLSLFNVVKDFPVAFIVEFMKRVRVLGKEKAIESISDLVDRVKNQSHTNYELLIDKDDSDDDDDDEYED